MATISLCMIVRDEEDVLARCLDSVKGLVDEIIITDTGSHDKTKAIAAGYTDQIYDFEWIDDFAAARNFSFSKAAMEYQMWLDADDVIEEKDREEFIKMKADLADADTVMLPYHVAFDEQDRPAMTYYRERLLRRSGSFVWQGAVHEAIAPAGKIIYGSAAVCHRKLHPSDPDRNLRIYEAMKSRGGITDPRHQFYYGRELYYHERYEEAAQVLDSFLKEERGWLENNISACLNLSECLMKTGNREEALLALFRSFRYDLPRPEVCCAIGGWFLEQSGQALPDQAPLSIRQAIYWYLQAKAGKTDEKSGAFVNPDCRDFIPDIQLCVCYDRLGNPDEALKYHELAKGKKPDHPAVKLNEAYFTQKYGTKEMEASLILSS